MSVGTLEKRRRRNASTEAPASPQSRGWIWAIAQLALLGVEVFAVLFLLAQPAFRPQHLEVTGIRHVSLEQVKTALSLPVDRNIFFLNQRQLEARVATIPWVRSATVTLALPDRMAIRVVEWSPSAVLQVGENSYFLNDVGKVLEPASEARNQLVINRPEASSVKDGEQAVAAELLPMLQQLRAGFQPAYKISITSFTIDRRDVLSADTDHGWKLIFGQMVTADDRASLEPKLAALRALQTRLDLSSRQIAYINLENPGAPAVMMRGKSGG